MTIRKRYEEAQKLIEIGQYEPALILLLVATSAASERLRKNNSNQKKKPGDDRKWFETYLTVNGFPKITSMDKNGNEITSTKSLYKDLRCEIAHEANSDNFKYDEGSYFIEHKDNKFKFGIELLYFLSKTIRKDRLLRDEFRDILYEFDNIIGYYGAQPEKEFRTNFIQQNGLSEGRYEIILILLACFTPEKLNKMDTTQIKYYFLNKIIPDIHEVELNNGALTALK
ncbi:hypothetical protein [Martelella mediterranea]|uniref:Uncharacterized protein n=1 Tax=Martelella mediterranea DSM 17316 TaxID=1122214 RepID=A0A1U9Z585_9HYPH|nr:hypothetical protein [Martelella mediterranea]AQZ52879.1 hypothetical protein Mame_03574 [Martelella mediterranea DSM 17316]